MVVRIEFPFDPDLPEMLDHAGQFISRDFFGQPPGTWLVGTPSWKKGDVNGRTTVRRAAGADPYWPAIVFDPLTGERIGPRFPYSRWEFDTVTLRLADGYSMCPQCGHLFELMPDTKIVEHSSDTELDCSGRGQRPRDPCGDTRRLWNGAPNPWILT